MDLWLTLRDGRTAPLTGVGSITSIDTVGSTTQLLASAITSGSANVTVSSTTGIRPGALVYGSGIPTGATVLSITSGTVFVMSANATATIGSLTVTVATVSDADQKLLTINSGWYRDIFSSNATNTYDGSPKAAGASPYSYTGPGVVSKMQAGGVPIGVSLDITISSQSDEVEHVALRQCTWKESLWAFECTVGAETMTLYFRKYEVVGMCNVAPSF